MVPYETDPSGLKPMFDNIPSSEHPACWNACWSDSFHPWTRPGPSLALADLIHQRTDLIPPSQERDSKGNPIRGPDGAVVKKTALVPGCGMGHDVLLLASLGYDVWGLDVSAAAVEVAKQNEKVNGDSEDFRPVNGTERGRIHWLAGNFFEEGWESATGKFDLIFDYTFLCALPMDLRAPWAARMTALLAPHGHLICLEFPSGKPLSDGGPPYGVSPEVYEALLAAPGEPIEYDARGEVVSLPSPKPRDEALHRLSLIKPPRTHGAGTDEDGYVRDFISVWCR